MQGDFGGWDTCDWDTYHTRCPFLGVSSVKISQPSTQTFSVTTVVPNKVRGRLSSSRVPRQGIAATLTHNSEVSNQVTQGIKCSLSGIFYQFM